MLEISNLSISYGSHKALENVSIDIIPGEITGIVGPNGAGKTTLFKALLGVIGHEGGRICFDGKAIFEVDRKNIGYLAEQPFFFDFFTPVEMLLFEAEMKDYDCPAERVDQLIEKLGLSEFKDIQMKNLSQGLKKRVAIAAAFLGEPSLLILDEPLNAIDIQTVIVLKELVKDAARNNACILISSHVLNFFDGLIQKTIFLERGAVCFVSSDDTASSEEIYKRLFMT